MTHAEIESALVDAIHIAADVRNSLIACGYFPGQLEADAEFGLLLVKVQQKHENFGDINEGTQIDDLEPGLEDLSHHMDSSKILSEFNKQHLKNPIRICIDIIQRCSAIIFDSSRFAAVCHLSHSKIEFPDNDTYRRTLSSDQLRPYNERINRLRSAMIHLSHPTEYEGLTLAYARSSGAFSLLTHMLFTLDEILLDDESKLIQPNNPQRRDPMR
jgi:hypothetical protein